MDTAMTFSHVEKGGGYEATIAILLWPILIAILTATAVNLALNAKGWPRRLFLLFFWIPLISILLSIGSDVERDIASWIYSFLNPNSSVGWWMSFPNWAPDLSFAAGLIAVYLNLSKRFSSTSNTESSQQSGSRIPSHEHKSNLIALVLKSKYMLAGTLFSTLIIGWIAGTMGIIRVSNADVSELELANACNSAKVHLDALEKLRNKNTASAVTVLEKDMYGNDAIIILSRREKMLPRVRSDVDELFKNLKTYYSRFGFDGEKEMFQGNYSLRKKFELYNKKKD